jgi:uncharacterized membrane protein YjfL (UPF0719 family)
VLFFVLLGFATFFRCLSSVSTSALVDAAKGAAIGYAFSVVAIVGGTLLMPDGFERIENSQRLVGSIGFAAHQLAMASVVGGWALGAVAFGAAPRIQQFWLRSRQAT